MPTLAEVRRHQADIAELVRLATIDLDTLWRDVSDGVIARELLAEVLPELTAVYGAAAATLGADWYDEIRDTEATATGRYTVQVAELPAREKTDVIARAVVAPMFSATPDPAATLDLAGGSLQRLIADMDRGTIIGAAVEDPAAQGWQRVTDGDACGFCRMLASRPAVYKRSTVDFGAHSRCGCAAVPIFGGPTARVRDYTPSARNITDADRARTRQWMREHGY